MTCRECTREIVERARGGAALSQAMSQHLAHCPSCAERWEAETELSRGMRQARMAAAPLHSAAESRRRLFAEFDARPRDTLRRYGYLWAAAAAMAACLMLAVRRPELRAPQAPAPAAETAQVFAEDLMADNEFVPVPYAPPLAPGEYLEVVQAQLTPAALARMGFVIQAGGAAEVTTDLMVGEDGLPRAVRVPESVGIRF